MAIGTELEPPPRGNALWGFGWIQWLYNLYKYVKENMGTDFLLEVAQGRKSGYSLVHKFGANAAVASTTMTPVCSGGVYQTPTSAVALEFVSSDTADALDDVGAHEITVVGLDANWEEQTIVTPAHATDGLIAVNISGTWLRVYRAWVSKSGAYASTSTASHVGTITVRVQGAGATYCQIPVVDGLGVGQSLIGAYTVPAGHTAYILYQNMSSDVSGTKTCDFFFFQRINADDVTSSYSGTMRVQNLLIGTQNQLDFPHRSAERFPEKTDIGFLAYASASTKASVEFELMIVAN